MILVSEPRLLFVLISLSAVILVICAVMFHLCNKNKSGREGQSVGHLITMIHKRQTPLNQLVLCF